MGRQIIFVLHVGPSCFLQIRRMKEFEKTQKLLQDSYKKLCDKHKQTCTDLKQMDEKFKQCQEENINLVGVYSITFFVWPFNSSDEGFLLVGCVYIFVFFTVQKQNLEKTSTECNKLKEKRVRCDKQEEYEKLRQQTLDYCKTISALKQTNIVRSFLISYCVQKLTAIKL